MKLFDYLEEKTGSRGTAKLTVGIVIALPFAVIGATIGIVKLLGSDEKEAETAPEVPGEKESGLMTDEAFWQQVDKILEFGALESNTSPEFFYTFKAKIGEDSAEELTREQLEKLHEVVMTKTFDAVIQKMLDDKRLSDEMLIFKDGVTFHAGREFYPPRDPNASIDPPAEDVKTLPQELIENAEGEQVIPGKKQDIEQQH